MSHDGRSSDYAWMCLLSFLDVRAIDFPLREIICFSSRTTHLFARRYFYIQRVFFFRFDEDLFRKLVQKLHDDEEDVKTACGRDRLASHADGSRTRVAVDVVFSFFLFKDVVLEDDGVRKDRLNRFFRFVKNL